LSVRKTEHSRLLLIIDDEEQLNRTLTLHLEKEYQVHSATSGLQGLAAAESLKPDCVLLDLHLPGMGGLDVLEKLQHLTSSPAVVIMTAYGEIRSAVQAIKRGATDYITKPFTVETLRQSLKEVLHPREQHVLREQGKFVLGDKSIVGECPRMQGVWAAVEKFAPASISTLLQGESGTGKELFARAIHALSKRAQGPFVPVDCAAVPDSLWESEFFGYERGAFTGASQAKPGLFTLAHGGTLFLDEVGNLPLPLQAKLLRVLQEREVRPLGAKRSVHPDVRVVAASNADLTKMIAQGSFRADLYYRLSAVTISLPPLRSRGDLPLLIQHFLELYGKQCGKQVQLAEETLRFLTRYAWPGNCRELENVIRSAVLLAEHHILPHHLPAHLTQGGETPESHGTERQSESEALHPLLPPDPAVLLSKMDIQVSLQMDLQNGIDLKQVGTAVARTVEGEIVKRVRSQVRSQAEMATWLKIDPKTLRARLKTGRDRDESAR
jgi:DNA-binding NtrC family response regulator